MPSGADSFAVNSAAGFKTGDAVLIERPVTEAWIPSETFESPGVAVNPPSLYLAQLRDRLGAAAVRHIGYIPR